MKKIIFFLLFIAGISSVTAQSKGNIEFGLNAGYNSSFTGDTYYYGNNTPRSGFNVGGSAEYFFSERWGLKVKAVYDRKGWNNGLIYDIRDNRAYSTNYSLDYLTIPVMANYHFGPSEIMYFNFGAYVGFLMNARDTAFNSDVKKDFYTTDGGLALGLGIKIPVSSYMRLFLEYDGQFGTTNIVRHNQGDYNTNNRNALNIGVNFMW